MLWHSLALCIWQFPPSWTWIVLKSVLLPPGREQESFPDSWYYQHNSVRGNDGHTFFFCFFPDYTTTWQLLAQRKAHEMRKSLLQIPSNFQWEVCRIFLSLPISDPCLLHLPQNRMASLRHLPPLWISLEWERVLRWVHQQISVPVAE